MEFADTISGIKAGKSDSMGDQIEVVYSKANNTYCVYGTPNRVKVQFADNDDLMREQRRALAPLYPLRGQIDGLLDTWRGSRRRRHAVATFDRRTADALTVALQGDQVHAETLLTGVKTDIIEEQESIGRASYLKVAAATAVLVFLGFMVIALLVPQVGQPLPEPDTVVPSTDALAYFRGIASFVDRNLIAVAAGFGALGALFSIAIGIRKREVRPDMQRRDNVIDAVLRVMIGVVSAVILFSLLRAELVTLSFGRDGAGFNSAGPTAIHVAIIVAFVAGFVEMLIGDYITKAVVKDRATEEAAATALRAASRESSANELNPRGLDMSKDVASILAPAAAATAGGVVNASEQPGPERAFEDGTDSCLCHDPVADADLTDDVELPAASGGVETGKAA